MRAFCSPLQTKLPLSTPQHHSQFCLYPDSWMNIAVFQEFCLNEALTSLLVVLEEMCCHLQKVFSLVLQVASCWITQLHCQ